MGENLVLDTMPFSTGFVAQICGMIATLCFTLQYVPQAYQNYKRQSCEGFSLSGIVIKLVGIAFLMVNSVLTGENMSVFMYGIIGCMQHCVFMAQFAKYNNDKGALYWILFPA
eukprot:113894_1